MKLIVCNTYSQLIIAIQLKLTIFKNESVDLWISDHSNHVECVIEPLREIRIFNDVKFLQNKNFVYKRSKINSLKDTLQYSFAKIRQWNIKDYDEIVFYSLSLMLYSIADFYRIKHHEIMWSRMEGGIFSYETDFESGFRIKLTRFFRKISRRIEIADKVKQYYCFFPELKNNYTDWNIVKIPSIRENRETIIPLIQKIFGMTSIGFRQKYIFFASSSDIDGNPYGETEMILKLADIVGKKNLLVKMHPRDTRRVYEDYGVCVMDNSWIPWEVIQLVGDFSDKCFLTVNSGAFITSCAMMNGNERGYFLYPSVTQKSSTFLKREIEIDRMLERMHEKNICMGINACSFNTLQKIENKEGTR